jgi:stage V sporulation protein B
MSDAQGQPLLRIGFWRNMRHSKQSTIVGGISVLAVAGLISKVVGVLYKIPLARLIGPTGMGIYHQVFPTYNLLLTISSAGIPVAISRLVAESLARDDRQQAKSVFRQALKLLTILGLIGTILLFLISPALSNMKGTSSALWAYYMIAPSLLLVCMMSALRGYMQGKRRMAPTAISQLIEQVGKVLIAMPLSFVFMKDGDFAMGAAGAMLGTSIAELLALIYMSVDYFLNREQNEPIPNATHNVSLTKKIVAISIPITLGACIVPIAAEIDSFMLVRLMSAYLPENIALIHYGTYTGIVFPLINIPTAFAMAVAANMVPNISAALEKKDSKGIDRASNTGLRLSSLIGMPASIGMSLLARPIVFLLFGGQQYSSVELEKAAQLLEVSSLTIFLFIHVQTTSGILQGLRKQRIPMYTLIFGVVLKVLLNYTLVRVPGINIHGAPFASLLCYFASLVPNLYFIRKIGEVRFDWMGLLVKPLIACVPMGLAVVFVQRLFQNALSWTALGLSVVAGVALYFVTAYFIRLIQKEDLPKRWRKN